MHRRIFTPDTGSLRPRSTSTLFRSGMTNFRAASFGLVLEWAMIHRAELLEDWRLCSEKTPPNKIDPLA